jgi:putative transposase
MAINNRSIEKGLVFHSDRGVQYSSKKYTNVLDSYKMITRSMSRRCNWRDNAVADNFFKNLKAEQIYGNKLISKEQMELDIFGFIEVWDDIERRHSALDTKTIGTDVSSNHENLNAHSFVPAEVKKALMEKYKHPVVKGIE